jgi:predicted glycoside hydrolase/deacetylase ChbG (UPF0249 family)
MAVRADDIGHPEVFNIGFFEAIENGVATTADVMLDSPGTEDALELLTALPWISVEWHMHLRGASRTDPKKVPVPSAAPTPVFQCRSFRTGAFAPLRFAFSSI